MRKNRTNSKIKASSLTQVLHGIGVPGPDGSEQEDVDVVRPFALLTAYRASRSSEENRAKQMELLAALTEAGAVVFPLSGSWQEQSGQGKTINIAEESVMAVCPETVDYEETFVPQVAKIAASFEQDSFILSDGGSVWTVAQTGEKKPIGETVKAQDIEEAYRDMRNQDVPFVFSNLAAPAGFDRYVAGRMSDRKFAKAYRKAEKKMKKQETKKAITKAKLRALVEASIDLTSFSSDGGTAKAWILPSGKTVAVPQQHYIWLKNNVERSKKEFGLDVPAIGGMKDDQMSRLWALNNGFTRVNYKPSTGNLTVELNERYWKPKVIDAVVALVKTNAAAIDFVAINVLDDNGKMTGLSDSKNLSMMDDEDKPAQIPVAAKTQRGMLIAAAFRRIQMLP
jgi:hypothetical protein